jgi:hypothetical protein
VTISGLLTLDLVLPALAAGAKAEVLDELALQVGRVHPPSTVDVSPTRCTSASGRPAPRSRTASPFRTRDCSG